MVVITAARHWRAPAPKVDHDAIHRADALALRRDGRIRRTRTIWHRR